MSYFEDTQADWADADWDAYYAQQDALYDAWCEEQMRKELAKAAGPGYNCIPIKPVVSEDEYDELPF